ncbi:MULTISPECIES: sulfatase [Halomicrobium]|uniref:Sulfatase n=2 Tax=Halomicrobium mukohataei TaxID=57705 RepID=C7P385_HALMD|nr:MULTISPECIES: sulfatase [Halomicrobium]ACV47557.1 sulfatase [Halomicrobium mukohataei DSM 12286]QCD66020.1 hypothetical protein E5139_10335 [Halomicrobium mukohataei]QFR20825.1 sulfatase-like hydrolase/transferase [Halomicrobium sp. ZPS1]
MSNVFVISFDALRYDHVSATRNGTQTTPFLDSIKEDAIEFTQHISTGSGTSTSFPGIHASSLPLDHGYAGLNENHVTLAEVLSDASIQTVGVTAQTSCSSIYDYDRGFEVFEDWVDDDQQTGESFPRRLKSTLVDGIENTPVLSPIASELKLQYDGLKDVYDTPACPYPRAEDVTDTTISLVDQHVDTTADAFVWTHYMEPHAPYYPPREDIERFHDGRYDVGRIRRVVRKARRARPDIIDGSMIEAVSETEIEALRDFYAAATRYVDREAKRLVDELDARGLLEDSVVLFTADHGEELFDRGTLGHRTKMYDELIRVPLLLYDNSGRYAGETSIDAVRSHVDIAPTIADWYGVDPPAEWRGVSLLEPLRDETGQIDRDYAIAELCHTQGLGGDVTLETLVAAVRSKRWKYIRNRQLDTEHLYDLRTDPDEQHNIAADHGDIVAELSTVLNDRLEGVSDTARDVDLSSDVEKQLRELGYVE